MEKEAHRRSDSESRPCRRGFTQQDLIFALQSLAPRPRELGAEGRKRLRERFLESLDKEHF